MMTFLFALQKYWWYFKDKIFRLNKKESHRNYFWLCVRKKKTSLSARPLKARDPGHRPHLPYFDFGPASYCYCFLLAILTQNIIHNSSNKTTIVTFQHFLYFLFFFFFFYFFNVETVLRKSKRVIVIKLVL